MRNAWERRFFATTTGRILNLLRKNTQTVDDLAASLDLSSNAVRNQISTLERVGLVASEGTRRGPSKPAWLYRLTPEAERLFPKPYATVLDQLLAVLAERIPLDELDATLDEVGHRLAAGVPALTGPTETRIPAVMETMGSLGGLAEYRIEGQSLVIEGFDCPLARTVTNHPCACRVVQAMLEDMFGQPVTEACDRSGAPRCQFSTRFEPAG
jgi:predicted ArsR family transcriptional regulator